jgi:hypothetical protein
MFSIPGDFKEENMKRKIILQSALAIIFLVALNSCARTTLRYAWKDNTYQGGTLKKVLIIGVDQQQTVRRFLEDEFARQLKSEKTDVVPSYIVLPQEKMLDKKMIVSKINELEMDSVLVVWLGDIKDIFHSYNTNPYQAVSSGYNLVLQARLFEKRFDELIWEALSETMFERYSEDVLKPLITTIIKDLHDKKLL